MLLITRQFFIILLTLKLCYSIVHVIKPNEKGQIALNASVNCLNLFSQSYFRNRESLTRAKNMILTHIWNMSSPAAEIEQLFLLKMHRSATKRIFLGNRYQLRIISDYRTIDGAVNVNSDQIVTTDYYVIVTDTIKRFQNILKYYLKRASAWNPAAKFIILYNNVEKRNESMFVANTIFNILLHKYFVTNAVLLYAVNYTGYEILRLNNFHPMACRLVTVEKSGYCLNGTISNFQKILKNYNKPIDLHNCTFRLCSKVAAPFVENNCTDGIEIYMINEMQSQLKFQLSKMCTTEDRGVIINGNWTDLLAKLDDHRCDFIIGGFYPDNEVRQDFWVTNPYLTDSHTWFISLAKKHPPWKGLVMIYENNTWQGITFVWFISWLTWFIIGNLLPEEKPHKSLSLTGIYALGVILGSTVNNQPKFTTMRLFFMALVLFGLNITNIYTSFLISVFANPNYDHQISTLNEVLELGIPFGGPKEQHDWFDNPQDTIIQEKYNDTEDFELTDMNFELVQQGKQVMLANRMFVIQSKYSDYLYGFPENVFTSPLEIITKKGFSLLYQFNSIIRRFQDAGLMEKIEDDFVFNNTILKNIKHPPHIHTITIVLTPHHLEGAFAALCFGFAGSIIGFICEILAYFYVIPWINKFFGLKIGKEKPKKIQNIENKMGIFVGPVQPIRFTPVERRKIVLKGKDLRKYR